MFVHFVLIVEDVSLVMNVFHCSCGFDQESMSSSSRVIYCVQRGSPTNSCRLWIIHVKLYPFTSSGGLTTSCNGRSVCFMNVWKCCYWWIIPKLLDRMWSWNLSVRDAEILCSYVNQMFHCVFVIFQLLPRLFVDQHIKVWCFLHYSL